MGFVIANAYSSFLLPKKKKLPCRAAVKGVLLKPKIIFSSLYNLGDRKNSSTKKESRDRHSAQNSCNDNNDKHWNKKCGDETPLRIIWLKPPYFFPLCRWTK